MENKMKPSLKLLCVAIAAAASGNALAVPTPTIDGINTGGSEYSNTQAWNFYSSHNPQRGVITGSLSWEVVGSMAYLLITAPIDYVDNVYGADALLAGSGWEVPDSKGNIKGHTFDNLLGSDSMDLVFDFDLNGSGDQNIGIDYIDETSSNTYEAVYDSKISTSYSGSVDFASSLEYNLNLDGGGACGDTTDSDLSDSRCVAEVSYELALNLNESEWGGSFNVAQVMQGDATCTTASDGKISCTGASGSQLHASPNKGGDTTTTPPNPVPAPPIFALLLAGIPGLLLTRRRSKTS